MPGKESLGGIMGWVFHDVQAWLQKERIAGHKPSVMDCVKMCDVVFNAKVRESWDNKVLEASQDQVKSCRGELEGLVKVFFPYAESIKPVAVEQKFEIVLPGLPDWTLYGYIDLIEEVDGGHNVVDYKTVGSSPYKEDAKDEKGTEERRLNYVSEAMWNPEVACYCLGYRVLYGKPENEFVYYNAVKLKTPKVMPVRVKVTDAQINWFLGLAIDMVKSIQNGLHEKRTNGNFCSPKGCEYWDFCHGISKEKAGSGQFVVS
jgi:hypothetical protein